MTHGLLSFSAGGRTSCDVTVVALMDVADEVAESCSDGAEAGGIKVPNRQRPETNE